MWYYRQSWRRKNKLKCNIFSLFGSSFPTFENIVMVTYALSFIIIFFSMNYAGHFCLPLPPILLGMAWATVPWGSKPGGLRMCSVLGGDLPPWWSARRSSVVCFVCWGVAEQNQIPLNQAALQGLPATLRWVTFELCAPGVKETSSKERIGSE